MKISEAKKKFTEHIIEGELATEAKKAISIFAPNKNVYRHIPFITDGLLPSERRVLYAMYKDVNALPKGNYKKLGLIIGAVMKYHPHGETNIYKTCVKLARPWKNAVEFIDGSGSYGNEMGKGASAFRYLEAKLSLFSLYCYFKDFDEAIVPMKDGYIDEITEPEYLPARYPAVLTKSCKAIGYGMYSEQPNYNFTEICEFVLRLMDNPDYDAIIYPDIPNGCEIIDDGQFDDIRRTGKGKFRMKSKANIDYENNKIEVLSVPMNTDLQQIKDKVIAMGKSGELVGYVDIHDQNDKRNGKKKRKKNSKEQAKLSIDILFKEGTDLDKALELLYKKTPMLTSAAYDLTLVDEYKLKEYTIRTLLLDWLSFRRDVKRRQINKQITKKTERVHVLDILIFISNTKNSKTTIELATKAYDVREFREMIMTEFGISTLQAASIGNMQITSFNKSAHEKYVVERDKLKEEIEKLMSLVKSSKKIDDIIKDELKEGIKLFGRPRKSNVVKFDLNNNYIADTDHRIVITKNDMIKKLGKRNTGIGELEEGDKGKDMFLVNNRDSILLFDKRGNMSEIKVNDINSTPEGSTGVSLSNMITVNGNIVGAFPKPKEESTFVVMTTKKGLSKKLSYKNINKIRGTVVAIKLADDDELVSVDLLVDESKDMIVYTREGGGVRINSDDIRECGRAAYGLSVIKLAEGDEVKGTAMINNRDKYILVVTNKGRMKKCTLSTFETMKRKSATLQISRLSKNEEIVGIKSVKDSDKFMVYTMFMEEEFKVRDIEELNRLHECKKVMKIPAKDRVLDIVIK